MGRAVRAHTDRRQLHGAPRADDELRIQMPFQLLQSLTDRARREEKLFRSLREASVPCDRFEGRERRERGKLTKFHVLCRKRPDR